MYGVHFKGTDIFTIDINAIIKNPAGTFKSEEAAYNEPPKEMNGEFSGDVYLLTDRVSYSAASSFAATFKCYQMGLIIGDETGGTRIFQANAWGEQLDHSDIYYRISNTIYYTPCYNELYESVPVDIKYTPTILDLKSDYDSHLNFATRIINKINRKKQELENYQKE